MAQIYTILIDVVEAHYNLQHFMVMCKWYVKMCPYLEYVLYVVTFVNCLSIISMCLLENPQKASTSEPDQMGICLNSLDSEPKPECMRNTSVTSYLQMMRP